MMSTRLCTVLSLSHVSPSKCSAPTLAPVNNCDFEAKKRLDGAPEVRPRKQRSGLKVTGWRQAGERYHIEAVGRKGLGVSGEQI
jgi:hypothetical protein